MWHAAKRCNLNKAFHFVKPSPGTAPTLRSRLCSLDTMSSVTETCMLFKLLLSWNMLLNVKMIRPNQHWARMKPLNCNFTLVSTKAGCPLISIKISTNPATQFTRLKLCRPLQLEHSARVFGKSIAHFNDLKRRLFLTSARSWTMQSLPVAYGNDAVRMHVSKRVADISNATFR